ncbi:MAG: hypothetical protein GF344_02620 [Chitinivibrionales bacterium]|nr:hypothetical protein [Chitinivibrionales bacterium]MBD3355977.1 hypothetical protein [Chitinivibrionales bacterium]
MGNILYDNTPSHVGADRRTVFRPLGLGVLDLAVADMIRYLAEENGRGIVTKVFFPDAWSEGE